MKALDTKEWTLIAARHVGDSRRNRVYGRKVGKTTYEISCMREVGIMVLRIRLSNTKDCILIMDLECERILDSLGYFPIDNTILSVLISRPEEDENIQPIDIRVKDVDSLATINNTLALKSTSIIIFDKIKSYDYKELYSMLVY